MKRHLKLTTALLALSAVLAGCNDAATDSKAPAAAGAERPPSPVSVVIMKKAEQPLTTLLPGRAAAFQVAEIRPRVSGIIKEIAFKEGGEVKAGDLLYKIEDDTLPRPGGAGGSQPLQGRGRRSERRGKSCAL